ncbi:unnamed protein product [Mytilus coruscus]|uniref:Fibronectin type-III domain-containing protein n=1 Tax=Mytilus coruscus TaxID=42192 RepID=A0A6J7ZTY4_MYTCO|nr:unnamed protein product [Mytilus coruscus]
MEVYGNSSISELGINPAVVNVPSYVIGGNVAKNGHRYTFTVKAHSNSLESAEYTEVFRTVITQPNPPIIQSCTDIVSNSIDLVWQEPLLPNGDVQYYLIDTDGASAPPQINTSTSVVTYKVEPLLDANTYCFFVRTVNDGAKNIQVSGNSNQYCCSTKADSSSEQTSVTTNVLSSRNISVSWNYPANPNGDIFGYRLRLKVDDICQVEIIFYCPECPNAIPYKDCGEDKQRQTITMNKTQINTTINYIVEQLLPYTKYDVWIAAHDAANDGMRNDSEVQTTSEVPQKPLSVVASVMSSSEITVIWNQPSPRPGITTYYIKAYEVVLNAQPTFVKLSNITDNNSRNHCCRFRGFPKLYSITPDRHYQVELYAVNTINQAGEKERKIYYASSKIERSRHALQEPQLADQYEDLGMDNMSSYQELGAKDNPNVYDQIGRLHTVDKHYENMLT